MKAHVTFGVSDCLFGCEFPFLGVNSDFLKKTFGLGLNLYAGNQRVK